MKIINLLEAREPLQRLLESRFTSFKVSRELANLKKSVEAEVEFYVSEEKKLVLEYASKDDRGNPVVLEGGRIRFDSVENKNAFEKDIFNLRNLEIDTVKTITLKESDFKSDGDIPTPNDILALEGIVDFE